MKRNLFCCFIIFVIPILCFAEEYGYMYVRRPTQMAPLALFEITIDGEKVCSIPQGGCCLLSIAAGQHDILMTANGYTLKHLVNYNIVKGMSYYLKYSESGSKVVFEDEGKRSKYNYTTSYKIGESLSNNTNSSLEQSITNNASSDIATVYIAYSSNKKSYYNFKVYYEIDGQFVATTAVQEYFKVQLPVGMHNICTYINPIKLKKDYTIDAKTQYYNNLEEIKQKSIYEPDCNKINVLPGNNYFRYSGDMIILTQEEFQERFNNGLLARESPAVVSSLVPQDNLKTPSKTVYSTKNSEVDKSIPFVKTSNDDTYVLIIANENYNNLSSVTFAANDGQIFKEYCIKTLGVPEKQVRYCVNTTYGEMVGAVDWLKYALNNFENSKAIVYYCGHGIPDEKTGQAYLIPVDGKGTNMTTCYSLKNLYKTLAATKAQSITYFMDACFTGANKEGSMLVAARGVAREPMKETLAGKTVVFSASSGDETAMTLEEQGHGLFTYYLLKKLQETEGNVTYGELADYINKNVKKDAFLINEKPQTPVVATSPAVQNTWKTMKLK